MPQTPAWLKIAPVLTQMTNGVLAGTKAPRDALAEAQREAQVALDEVRR